MHTAETGIVLPIESHVPTFLWGGSRRYPFDLFGFTFGWNSKIFPLTIWGKVPETVKTQIPFDFTNDLVIGSSCMTNPVLS